MNETDELKNLETVSIILAIDVRYAVQSSITNAAAQHFFACSRDSFVTNPANTYVYAAIKALEERSVVRVAECLKDEQQVFGMTGDVRRTESPREYRRLD